MGASFEIALGSLSMPAKVATAAIRSPPEDYLRMRLLMVLHAFSLRMSMRSQDVVQVAKEAKEAM
jgi:hypothetical protein